MVGQQEKSLNANSQLVELDMNKSKTLISKRTCNKPDKLSNIPWGNYLERAQEQVPHSLLGHLSHLLGFHIHRDLYLGWPFNNNRGVVLAAIDVVMYTSMGNCRYSG